MELAFWESIKDGANPALFQAYLTKYPEGHFSDLARIKLVELKGPEQPAATPQPERQPQPQVQAEAEAPPSQPRPQPAAPQEQAKAAPPPEPAEQPEVAPAAVSVERLPIIVGPAGVQTRVAQSIPELQALANSRPDRRYSVFQAEVTERFQLLGRHGAHIQVKKVDAKKGRYTLTLREGASSAARPGPGPSTAAPSLRPETKVSELDSTAGRSFEAKNATPGEVIQFHAQGDNCDEVVILEVRDDRVIGYLVEAVRP